jgi:steroid delta-isomerase-like uncharacterized protein
MATTQASDTAKPLDPEFLKDFASRWEAAWNGHRVEPLVALMTEDIAYDDSSWPTTMHGRAEIGEFAEHTWRAMPDLEFHFIDGPWAAHDAPTAAAYWVGTATHTGPLDPPGFAATGKSLRFEGTDVWEFRGELLCRLRITFDMLDISRQLGVLPPAGSPAERALAAAQRAQRSVARRLGR